MSSLTKFPEILGEACRRQEQAADRFINSAYVQEEVKGLIERVETLISEMLQETRVSVGPHEFDGIADGSLESILTELRYLER